MIKVFRKEKKFLIDYVEYKKTDIFLKDVMISDEHNDYSEAGYVVRSLYFDTIDDDDYFDKINGLNERQKVRIRIYSPYDKFAKLELKSKTGDNQTKESLKITKSDAEQIINGNYLVLLNYEDEFAKKMYTLFNEKMYRPKVIIEYNRKSYIANENNIRITFDSNIKYTESSYDLFNENLLFDNVDMTNTVMEVKYNNFLPTYIKDYLNDIDKSEVSVSKYILGRNSYMYM